MASRHPKVWGAGMNKRFLASCLAGATGLALAACSERPMDIDRTFSMTPPIAHGTGAKTRLITTTVPDTGSTQGRVVPKQIVCAEASPDTASSISSALTAAMAGSGEGKGVSAALAGQFGKAVAESLVQLTERTATIQLLRDGYHRACEGYANGAISDITYALIISRLDEVMVTMMTSELAAGAFGRSLASTSGSAGFVQGGEPANVQQAEQAVADLNAKVKTSEDNLAAKRGDLKTKSLKPNPTDAEKGELVKLQGEIDAAQTERDALALQKTRAELSAAMARLGKSGGFAQQTGTGAGGIAAKPDKETAAQIGKIYERFMDGNPLKKMVVACITALDRPEAAQTPVPTSTSKPSHQVTTMNSVCKKFFEDIAQRGAMARMQSDLIEMLVRACSNVPEAQRWTCIDKLKDLAKLPTDKIEQKADADELLGDMRPAVASAPLPPLSTPSMPKKP